MLPPSPAGRTDVPREGVSQLPGVLGVQVDLVIGAVQPDTDCAVGLAAVEVVEGRRGRR